MQNILRNYLVFYKNLRIFVSITQDKLGETLSPLSFSSPQKLCLSMMIPIFICHAKNRFCVISQDRPYYYCLLPDNKLKSSKLCVQTIRPKFEWTGLMRIIPMLPNLSLLKVVLLVLTFYPNCCTIILCEFYSENAPY